MFKAPNSIYKSPLIAKQGECNQGYWNCRTAAAETKIPISKSFWMQPTKYRVGNTVGGKLYVIVEKKYIYKFFAVVKKKI